MTYFLEIIEEKCGPTHNQTELSMAVSITSFSMMVFTIPFNVLLIYVLIKDRRTKYKNMFYKLLLSIAFADLLTGLVADPAAVNMLTKEALMQTVTDLEVVIVHVAMFYTDAVALLTLTILSIERIIAIVCPIKHFKGVTTSTESVLISCAWSGAVILVLPYFKLNFIKQSLVFSTVNVSIAVLSLFITLVTYHHKLRRPSSYYRKPKNIKSNKSVNNIIKINLKSRKITSQTSSKTYDNNNCATKISSSPTSEYPCNNNRILNSTIRQQPATVTATIATTTTRPIREKKTKLQQANEQYKTTCKRANEQYKATCKRTNEQYKATRKRANEQYKATCTFIAMICVFLATYLPTVGSMLYMNFCKHCNCDMIHIMRDVSGIFILSSSLFRPLNFILTLKHIRSSVYQLFKKKHEQFTISGRPVDEK